MRRFLVKATAVLILNFVVTLSLTWANTSELHAHDANSEYENQLLGIVDAISSADLDTALKRAETFVHEFPKSQIGHVLKADILQAKGGNLAQFADTSAIGESTSKGFMHQLRNRWLHASVEEQTIHEMLPRSLVSLGDHPYVLVADMPKGRLYVYKNNQGEPHLVRDYYLTLGSAGFGKEVEGDNKTPVGVYEVNDYIPGERLPDLYGGGAFPVDYPNRYDRFLKRTGYGIWLHGTPSDTYARSPWASEGCFVLSNDDLADISQYLSADGRTPVVLSDNIDWVDRQTLNTTKAYLTSLVEKWRRDWESLDTNAYLSHYKQQDFNFGTENYSAWADRKSLVNKGKTFVQVDLKLQSLFLYPGRNDMFVVKFRQNYLSNNYSGSVEKRQYWQKSQSGRWQIVFEG